MNGRLSTLALARRSFGWVWRASRSALIATIALQVVSAIAIAVGLLAGRSLIEELTGDPGPGTVGDVTPQILLLGAALLVSGLGMAATREARQLIAERVLRMIHETIISVATSVSVSRYHEPSFHDAIERAQTHGATSAMRMVLGVVSSLQAIIMGAALLGVLAGSVPETLPALVVLGVPFLIAARAVARLSFRTVFELTADDRLRSYLFLALVGEREAREVRIFGLHAPLRERWDRLFTERLERLSRLAWRRIAINGLAVAVSAALLTGVFLVVVRAAVNDDIGLADAALAIVALQQAVAQVRAITTATGSLREAALFLNDFEEFEAQRVQEDDVSIQPGDPLPPFEELRVKRVSFTYPGMTAPVLHDVDLRIGPNEVVAVVGESGGGKSTLAHVLAGLYEPTTGTITWDGADIGDVDRARWWRSIGFVSQDFVRYALTARENVTVSDFRRMQDLAAATEAAERAGVDDVLANLPSGYETLLSKEYEGGVELSMGQWQRVAVARAFFRDAPLLVLDEPASALDPIAEQHLYEQVEALCKNRAALLISHRFSTVRLADRIYVVDDGRIVEHGTHDELMQADGRYAALFRVQAAGYLRGPT